MKMMSIHQLMEKQIESEVAMENVPSLLLHSCCAPCSSACIEKLADYFHITVFYYNPNIENQEEYDKRANEQRRLIEQMPTKYPVHFIEGAYEPERFLEMVRGHEKEAEGGSRCELCFRMRLTMTATVAKEQKMDYFTTTLTISPLKNATLINRLMEELAKVHEIQYLASDFKKKEGYKRSIELSKEYNLYRQNYCGCMFSK